MGGTAKPTTVDESTRIDEEGPKEGSKGSKETAENSSFLAVFCDGPSSIELVIDDDGDDEYSTGV